MMDVSLDMDIVIHLYKSDKRSYSLHSINFIYTNFY